MALLKPADLTLELILERLRGRLPELRERYKVRSLSVFGSCVRGEQRQASDVDVPVEFQGDDRPSLLGLIDMENELSHLLGLKVDLAEKRNLKPFIGRRILAEVVWIDDGVKQGGAV